MAQSLVSRTKDLRLGLERSRRSLIAGKGTESYFIKSACRGSTDCRVRRNRTLKPQGSPKALEAASA